LAKPKKKTGVASGAEKALGLERPKAFKREHAEGADSTLPPGSAAASSSAAAASSGVIYPPVVLAPSASGVASKSLWGLNKNELHEIDANLSALREADRSIDKMEASSKRGEGLDEGEWDRGKADALVPLRRTHVVIAYWHSLVSHREFVHAELVEREKRAVEMQVSNFMKSDSGQSGRPGSGSCRR